MSEQSKCKCPHCGGKTIYAPYPIGTYKCVECCNVITEEVMELRNQLAQRDTELAVSKRALEILAEIVSDAQGCSSQCLGAYGGFDVCIESGSNEENYCVKQVIKGAEQQAREELTK